MYNVCFMQSLIPIIVFRSFDDQNLDPVAVQDRSSAKQVSVLMLRVLNIANLSLRLAT